MKHLKLYLSAIALMSILAAGLAGCKKDDNGNVAGKPKNVTALTAVPGDSKITLQWELPQDPDFSHVEITFAPQNDDNQPILVAAPETSTTIDGLTNGTEYRFIVIAVDQGNKKSLALGLTATPAIPADTVPDSTDVPEPTTGIYTDVRDGQTYRWVKIGDQTWMVDGLKYLPPGAAFSAVGEGSNVTDFTKHYYIYGFEAGGQPDSDPEAVANRNKYGILYNWYAVINLPDNVSDTVGLKKYLAGHKQVQGLAPEGWHIPSDSEYMVLEKTLGMQESELTKTGYRGPTAEVGRQLKTTDGWDSNIGTDDVGFGLLPTGRWKSGKFELQGGYGYLWSSTLSEILLKDGVPQARAWIRYTNATEKRLSRNSVEHFNAYPIRCVKDQ